MARRSAIHKAAQGEAVSFNMTPMIDCTFQLIIFFILASQVANSAYAKDVKVPRPHVSRSVPQKSLQLPKVTINVVSADPHGKKDPVLAARADFYEVNAKKYEVGDIEPIVTVIEEEKAASEAAGLSSETIEDMEFFIEIRADKRIRWEDVAPAVAAGVAAGVKKMHITALTFQK